MKENKEKAEHKIYRMIRWISELKVDYICEDKKIKDSDECKKERKSELKRKWLTQFIFIIAFLSCCIAIIYNYQVERYSSVNLAIVYHWIGWGVVYIIIVYTLYKRGLSHEDGEKVFNMVDLPFFSIIVKYTGGINSELNYVYLISLTLACCYFFFTSETLTTETRRLTLGAYIFALGLNHFWATWPITFILLKHYLIGFFWGIILIAILHLVKELE